MIFDCFLYSGIGAERQLLELRMAALPYEDVHHIIIESAYTFTGHKKGFNFPADLDFYQKHESYFTYQKVDIPPYLDPWENEKLLRNMIQIVLDAKNPTKDDIVIISDLDEVPRWQAIKQYRPEFGVCSLLMDQCYYYLNTIATRQTWRHPKILPYSERMKPDDIRRQGTAMAMLDAGHHFSYLGGVDAMLQKMSAFSHQEEAVQQFAKPELIEDKLQRLELLWDKTPLSILEMSELPAYAQNDAMKNLLYVQP